MICASSSTTQNLPTTAILPLPARRRLRAEKPRPWSHLSLRHAHLVLRMRNARLTGHGVTCEGASRLPQSRFLSRQQPLPPRPPGGRGSPGRCRVDKARAGFGSAARYAVYLPLGEGRYRAAGEMEALGQGRGVHPAASE